MPVIDAQIHLWEAHRPDRPWPAEYVGQKITPQHRAEPLLAPEMLAMMNAVGVDRAIVVPPSTVGENNATALEAAAAHPDRFAVMGRINPVAPDAVEQVKHWREQPGMLGIRLTFHKPHWVPWLDGTTLDAFWEACETYQVPVMSNLPDLLHKVPGIVAKRPGLLLILDHMSRRSGKYDAEAFADFDQLLALAKYPNVAVKTTCVPGYTKDTFPFRAVYPYLKQVYDAFGPKRMLWGSDISRLPCSYRECYDHFAYELDFLTAEDQRWIFGETCAALLRWP